MANTFRQPGDTIDITLSATKTVGLFEQVGFLVGVYMKAGVSGDVVPFMIAQVHEAPVATADVIAVGDSLYWDVADAEFNKTAAANLFSTKAITAAAGGIVLANVLLLPGGKDVVG